METVDNDSLAFYPAFCFKASPTHFAWVKMAAVDVHRLKKRPGFEGVYSLVHVCFVFGWTGYICTNLVLPYGCFGVVDSIYILKETNNPKAKTSTSI